MHTISLIALKLLFYCSMIIFGRSILWLFFKSFDNELHEDFAFIVDVVMILVGSYLEIKGYVVFQPVP